MTERIEYSNLIETMRAHKICVIVPTYNNAGTIGCVIEKILEYSSDVIVVNDGSTDSTLKILTGFGKRIHTVSYDKNKGKGFALKKGFGKAVEMGYEYAITLDSDGQHYPEDIPLFVKAIVEYPGALIIGERNLDNVDINGKSSFANKFSNFWFAVQTGKRLKDTQTGFRAYPLRNIYGKRILTSRYEAELELLVFAAWNGVEIVSIPINVYYPPQSERVSHFRPGIDFTRISILNTFLCFGAIIYGSPNMIWRNLTDRKYFRKGSVVFTKKNGIPREYNITIGRFLRSAYAAILFLFWSVVVFNPLVIVNFDLTKPTKRKRNMLHVMLQRISSLFLKIYPGSSTEIQNSGKEAFDKPVMIVANHQSLLDLPLIMSVNKNLVFLTNDQVWNNPLFGNIIRKADFLPVSAGMDNILSHLKDIKERGYSVVIFPEGTRSDDCSINRFHQGAFLLARELDFDIVPMVIHGAGHYLAKNDLLLRKNRQTLRIMDRISSDRYANLPFRKQASMLRRLISNEYDNMRDEIEVPSYFKSLVLYKYAYRGWKTVATCKSALNQLSNYESLISKLDGNIVFINSGIGVIPLLCALSNRKTEVYAYVESIREFETFIQTPGLPENLHAIHSVWHDDYNNIPCNCKLFVIDSTKLMNRFRDYSPILISTRP